MLGKGLLLKPVPPLAKARWYLRLTVLALESHLSTGLLISESPRAMSMSILMPVDFQGHSVNISNIRIKLRGGALDLRVPGAEGR